MKLPDTRAPDVALPLMPKLALGLLALAPALSGTARGLLLPGLKVSDLLLLLALALLLSSEGLRIRLLDRTGVALLGYALVYVFVTLLNFLERPTLPMALLQKELLAVPQFLLLYCVVFGIASRHGGLAFWARLSLYIAAAVGVIALLQSFDVPMVRQTLSALTGNPDILRPVEWKAPRTTGTFSSWHALGMYLTVNAVIAVALLVKAPLASSTRLRVAVSLSLVLLGLATALTFTPLLIVVAATTILLGLRRSLRVLPIVGVLASLVLWSGPVGDELIARLERQENVGVSGSVLPQTLGYRWSVWRSDYFPLISDNLIGGYGPIVASDRVFPYAESMYVHLLTTGGVLLLVSFLWFFFAAFWSVRRAATSNSANLRSTRGVAAGMSVCIGLLVVAQLIHPYMVDAGGSWMLVACVALVGGESSLCKERMRLESLESGRSLTPPRYRRPATRI